MEEELVEMPVRPVCHGELRWSDASSWRAEVRSDGQ